MLQFLAWLVVFHCLLGLGITIGYHRLLTHRSFACPVWLERSFATLGWMAMMGNPISWVAVHRYHHASSDRPDDPHSPVHEGWWWSQVGWVGQRIRDERLVRQGRVKLEDYKGLNSWTPDTPFVRKYAKDLYQDPYYRSLGFGLSILMLPLTAWMCFMLGGWPMMLGRLLAAATIVWATWYVNSYGHTKGFGYRNFDTRDASRNVWWVALLTNGEGWHNNHHHRPLSARHGMRWWEFDLSWVVIQLLQRAGLADHVHAYTYAQALERPEDSRVA